MKQTLLLIDDELNVLRSLERVFHEDGYHILTATSGEEGLKILAKFPVQVIISDQRMPNMTGSEFLTEVRKYYPDTIRIILSAYAEFESVKAAINEGAIYKFYTKPWEAEELRKGIREAFLINAQQTEKELQLIRLINYSKLSGLNIDELSTVESSLENDLNDALDKDEFIIYYQPIVFAKTGKIKGAEALVYWQHPSQGLIEPSKFIPLSEITGLILPISAWVFKTACRQLKQWQTQGYTELSLAINLSSYQFNHPGLLDLVREVLQNTSLSAQYLELEVTESLIMYNVESNLVLLKKLKELGVKLSLDDFGTGYSSLSYLKNFPIDTLKIDKSFMLDVSTKETSAEIMTVIIALAKVLGLTVIAEGVETKTQLDFLKEKNCDLIQGYYFSKPIIAEEFIELLNTNSMQNKI